MSGKNPDRIVSSGRRALRSTPDYQEAVREARDRVDAEFAPLIDQAGIVSRQTLYVRRWLRRRRAIEALAPSEGMYAAAGGGSRLNR